MKPYLDILKLVWPLALGMVNNALMQFVDRAFLARESMASLEAALPASILAFNVLGFFHSVIAYSGTFVAQYRGAGDARMCRMSFRAGTFLALASGALALLFVPAGSAVLELFTANGEVLARELSYYRIVTAGGVFLFLQMAVTAYFTGLGRTRPVFWVNVAGNAFNAALDPVLIFGLYGCPRLGIAGAAYATVAATALQWIALAWLARGVGNGERGTGNGEREDGHETGDERRDEVPSRLASNVSRPTPTTPTPPNPNTSPLISLILRILRYGVPSGAYTALNLLSFTIFVFVTGRVGDVAFAVSNACFSVNYLLFAPMEGFSIGAATLVGEAQGRGDPDAAHRAAMRTLLLGVSFVAAISLAAVVLSRPILALFAPKGAAESAEFLSLGTTLFLWMAAWQVFDATDIIISGALKGAGDTKFVFWWMLIVAFGVWLPVVWIVARAGGGMAALWSTMVVYVVVICVGSLIRWRFGRWRRIKLV